MRPLILLLILSILFPSYSYSKEAMIPAFDTTANEQSQLPRNFRDLSIFGINAIASGQFSAEQLREVGKKYPNDKIIVIDLRAENHGFINGEAISWHSAFEKVNQNKNSAQIKSDEISLLNSAKKDGEFVVNKILSRDRENGWYKSVEPKIINVDSVIAEEELATRNGFKYRRFPIRDFDVPNQQQFDEIVAFIKSLPSDEKLYVHCAGGKGRTGTFLVMMDILKNGKNTSLTEIFDRQHQMGAAKLNKISRDESWSDEVAKQRLKMLESLYQRSKTN